MARLSSFTRSRDRAARVGPARAVAIAFLVAGIVALAPLRGAAQSPQAAASDLINADRAFSAASANRDLADALNAMFADDVIMPAPQGKLARGREAVIAALKANPANAGVIAEWSPVRAGVSADGEHGFTFGFMTTRRADGPPTALKYLAYWVKHPEGWRVAAYKRVPRAAGDVLRESMPPSLPPALVPPTADPATIGAHRASLVAAEQGFSDLANQVGLGNAFRATGRADAVNLGGPTSADFVYGNEAIARLVAGGGSMDAKPFTWSAETAYVASSGDLGVTFGFIRQNGASADATPFPFFTIWRRDGVNAPWKYIAE
jgi:ketosteroid isomerase-like protein